MIESTTDVVFAAKEYIKKGYTVIPVNKKQPARFRLEEQDDGSIKKVSKGWEKAKIPVEEVDNVFTHNFLGLARSVPINIGITSSENNLLDLDLDCSEARLLSPYFLPETESIFGRDSSRNAHWLYSLDSSDNAEYFKYSYLVDPQDNKTDVTLLEIRPLNGTGRQTVFPPSIHHPSKEPIEFSKNGEPSLVDFCDIKEACDRLAVASLIAMYLNEGARQDLIISFAGTLAKIDWQKSDILEFIDPILKTFDDPKDYRTRLQGIEQTIKKAASGKPVTGITKLKELLPDHVFQKIKLWLGIVRTEFPIFEHNNCIFFRKLSAKGPVIERLTSFAIKPVKSISVPEDGTYLQCVLNTESGRALKVTFPPEAFDSSAKFKRSLSRYCNDHTVYLGSDVQTQLIKEFLSMLNKDEVIGSSVSGFNTVAVDGKKRTFFITEDGGLALDEEKNEVKHSESVSFINSLSQDCKLVMVNSPYKDEIEAIKAPLLNFNSPEIVHAVLGWTVACFFKDYFIKDYSFAGFPILFISGGSGSGKSKTAKNVIHNIWGIESQLKSFIEQSNFTIVKYMGSSNNIPIVFDEAKLTRMSKYKKDVFSNLIRISYDNSVANKGRQDQSMVEYKYSRPLVLCSETGLNEAAHLDRTIFVNFSRVKSKLHEKSFLALSEMDLSILGRALIDYVLTEKPAAIKAKIDACFNKVPEMFEDRPRVCLSVILFGLKVLEDILEVKIEPKELFEKQGEHFYSDSHDSGTKISEVDKTLTTWCLMSMFTGEHAQAGSFVHDTYLEEDEHYKVRDGCIYLHIPSIFPLFRKWDKTYEHQGDLLDQRTFMQQVKEEVYFMGANTPTRMGNKTQRCVALNMDIMVKKGIDLFSPWTIEPDEPAVNPDKGTNSDIQKIENVL